MIRCQCLRICVYGLQGRLFPTPPGVRRPGRSLSSALAWPQTSDRPPRRSLQRRFLIRSRTTIRGYVVISYRGGRMTPRLASHLRAGARRNGRSAVFLGVALVSMHSRLAAQQASSLHWLAAYWVRLAPRHSTTALRLQPWFGLILWWLQATSSSTPLGYRKPTRPACTPSIWRSPVDPFADHLLYESGLCCTAGALIWSTS